jgi:hypothetical protein
MSDINNTIVTTNLVLGIFNAKLSDKSKVKILQKIRKNLSGHWVFSPTSTTIKDWVVDEEENADTIEIIDELLSAIDQTKANMKGKK